MRIKSSIVGLLLILVTCVATAQENTTRFYKAFDRETITVDNTSGGVVFTATKILPSTKPYRAELVSFVVECASGSSCPMRFTVDGTAPTTSVGILVDYGTVVYLYNYDNISNFKAIRTGSTSASIQPTYWY